MFKVWLWAKKGSICCQSIIFGGHPSSYLYSNFFAFGVYCHIIDICLKTHTLTRAAYWISVRYNVVCRFLSINGMLFEGEKNTIQKYWGLVAVVLLAGDSMMFLNQQTTVFIEHENNCNVGWAYGPRVGIHGCTGNIITTRVFFSLYLGCVYTIY